MEKPSYILEYQKKCRQALAALPEAVRTAALEEYNANFKAILWLSSKYYDKYFLDKTAAEVWLGSRQKLRNMGVWFPHYTMDNIVHTFYQTKKEWAKISDLEPRDENHYVIENFGSSQSAISFVPFPTNVTCLYYEKSYVLPRVISFLKELLKQDSSLAQDLVPLVWDETVMPSCQMAGNLLTLALLNSGSDDLATQLIQEMGCSMIVNASRVENLEQMYGQQFKEMSTPECLIKYLDGGSMVKNSAFKASILQEQRASWEREKLEHGVSQGSGLPPKILKI